MDKNSEGTHKSKAEQHISRIPVIEVEGNTARCMVNLYYFFFFLNMIVDKLKKK